MILYFVAVQLAFAVLIACPVRSFLRFLGFMFHLKSRSQAEVWRRTFFA